MNLCRERDRDLGVAKHFLERAEFPRTCGEFNVFHRELSGMGISRGLGGGHDLVAEGFDVADQAFGLEFWVQPADEPFVVGGDAGGAVVGVALLGLDAADREHGLAGHVDDVATHGHGDDGPVRETQLAGADKQDLVRQSRLRKNFVDAGETQFEGE